MFVFVNVWTQFCIFDVYIKYTERMKPKNDTHTIRRKQPIKICRKKRRICLTNYCRTP